MTAYPAWTPASRPGIVPLHPLSFGTILGRSFVALRQNPRVLLGFALVVQTIAYVIVVVLLGVVSFATFSRLDTLRPGTEEFDTVLAGSVAIMIVASLVLGLAAGALTVIVQAVVVLEVTHAVVSERLTLGALWRKVAPVAWRLLGYSLILVVVATAVLAAIAGIAFAVGVVALPLGIVLGILSALALIPLYWWLMIKLLLVSAVILVERATIRGAIRRSWSLTRGRFWPSLGVIFLITMIFSAVAQVASVPLSFLSFALGTVIAPTGEVDASGIVAVIVGTVLTYGLVLLVQSIAVVVQSTATALIYVDGRMRHEGLDLDLLEYVEKRDAGAADLPDPYLQHIGRDQPSRYVAPVPGYPVPGSPPPPGAWYPYAPAPGYTPGSGYPPSPGYPPPPVAPAPSATPDTPTPWAPPTSGGTGRETT